MKFGFVAALSCASSVAFAQPGTEEVPAISAPTIKPPDSERGFVGGGVMLGGDHFFNAAWVVEGAIRIPNTPLWARGQGATGGTGDFEGTGDFKRGMVGIEGRSCATQGLCGYLGLDVGYQTQTWNGDEMTEHHEGLLVGPRGGLDVGGETVRFRLGLQLYKYHHHDDFAGSQPAWQGGGDLTMMVAVRL